MAEAARRIQEPLDSKTEQEKDQNLAQYLTFTLGDEEYGVDILRVQEIRSWEPVSRIPNVPAYEKGVINLRGSIVPIIDLRERFALGHAGYTPITAVIILQTNAQGKTRIMGVVVDAVSEVVDVDTQQIQASPDFGVKVSIDFISGLSAVGERMIMILDVDKLLSLDDMAESEDAA